MRVSLAKVAPERTIIVSSIASQILQVGQWLSRMDLDRRPSWRPVIATLQSNYAVSNLPTLEFLVFELLVLNRLHMRKQHMARIFCIFEVILYPYYYSVVKQDAINVYINAVLGVV
jgi:hypothetical protein